ncbi:hypothetical protein NUW54_g998 [Trametes sanguinea]|uniref:Uncharacterized protein n=1 Tax=Trametes sanguinea TaxID=158606 RepID=A0ACC1Q9C7_9APHY|nr:hypothetical protein NUW54_g998 [Trametes sanguinea]
MVLKLVGNPVSTCTNRVRITLEELNVPYELVAELLRTWARRPARDAIAIYAVEPQLAFVKHVFTGLDQIRGMELSGGSENEFLVAAGVAGDAGVVVLRRTQGGADLEVVATNKDVPTRSSFVWLD